MSYINSINVGGSTYNLRDEEAIHDVSTLATKEELNGKLDSGALNNYMTTDQVNNALANKADSSALNDYMTTEQINNALQDKVSASQLDNFATKEDLTAKVDKNELNNYATKEDLNNVSGGSNVNMSVEGTTLILTISSGGSGGGSGQPNFTDVYTTNITNISRPDSTKYVYTVDDSAFANMANTMSSYSPDHWNGAFRDSHGSQWGFGEFSIVAATSSADGFDGYKAPGPDGIILAFNTADNTITFNQSADATELQNAAVFVLQRVI